MSSTASGLRAAIYDRVSHDRRASRRSVDEQNAANRAACAERNWDVVAEYADNDRSASRFARKARPDWGRLVADLGDGRFDVLVLWEASRIGSFERGDTRPTDSSCHRLAAALVASTGGDEVDVAALSLDLQAAAGESLRLVHRRRPLRRSRVTAYELARQRRAATDSAALDVLIGAAVAALDLPADEAELWAGQRPAVRSGR